MFSVQMLYRLLAATLVALVAGLSTAHGQSAQDQFYKAYYLEQAKGDAAGASELYAEVVGTRGISDALKTAAKHRLAACREELATADLARLMPPEPLAYIEISRPGDRICKLVDKLGLLASPDNPPKPGEARLAISPAVIDAVLGIRGLAVAVTGFDMAHEQPSGVMVFDPGDIELIRGLIETALPAGGEVIEPIGGYTTYKVEDAFVTLTARLVIVGTSPMEIEAVVDRLNSPHEESLATNPALADVLAERDGALLYFCVNPKPLMPMLSGMMAGMAAQNREFAMANALLDIQSLHSLTGRFDLSDEGLILALTLRLDEGHRNLVFDFFRRPAIDPETLRCVPAGAAGFFAMAMNEAPAERTEKVRPIGERPVVTALDFGRELFANINGLAVFALPPAKTVAVKGEPIPDVAAAITVNDPDKSEALWTEILGLASMAAGAPTMDGETQKIAGVEARSYRFEDGIRVYVGTLDHTLLIASSAPAFERSVAARRSGESVLDDEAFATPLAQIGPHTTMAVLANPARCLEIARPFMSPSDIKEAEPIIGLLHETTGMFTIDQSSNALRVSATVTGVPNISALVNEALTRELHGGRRHQEVRREAKEKHAAAIAKLEASEDKTQENLQTLKQAFAALAAQGDNDAARAVAEKAFKLVQDDANALNDGAWALLTEERYAGRFDDVALRWARRACKLTEHENAYYLDTLALAEFKAGDAKAAVKLEKKAVELCKKSGGGALRDMEVALKKFQAAAAE